MKKNSLNKQIIIRRLSQFSLALVLVAGLASLLWHSQQQSKEMRAQQEASVSGILKQQLALAATMGLKLNDQQQLQWLAQTLNESPLINGVWIHRSDGTLMAESTVPPVGPTIMLAEEIRQDALLGYLRLRLNQDVFVQPIVEIQQQQLEWQRWSLLLAGLIGILLARALSQKRAKYQLRDLLNKYRRKERSEQQEIKES
ncbi:hypothetical protein MHM98_05605 [Psychrobium sp. MM17-31]|uniref:hypothetical protein n=1 Tax=Psychrobium sp. MM17-31 TaxID=2917758 RepID=UPI001EF3EB90|nr:hypothetical protein [Psychrobium sp. MM17-31]MCG7530833.1 hypothetical protein [Psychrobium sp. MM17-31]